MPEDIVYIVRLKDGYREIVEATEAEAVEEEQRGALYYRDRAEAERALVQLEPLSPPPEPPN